MTDSAHYRGDMPASKYDSMDADTPDGTCSTCGRKSSTVACDDCGKCLDCDCDCDVARLVYLPKVPVLPSFATAVCAWADARATFIQSGETQDRDRLHAAREVMFAVHRAECADALRQGAIFGAFDAMRKATI